MFFNIMYSRRKLKEDIQKVEECLKAVWEALPNSLFKGYIKSMKRRIDMCIAAKRWHTKY
jgi:hypothetical protein